MRVIAAHQRQTYRSCPRARGVSTLSRRLLVAQGVKRVTKRQVAAGEARTCVRASVTHAPLARSQVLNPQRKPSLEDSPSEADATLCYQGSDSHWCCALRVSVEHSPCLTGGAAHPHSMILKSHAREYALPSSDTAATQLARQPNHRRLLPRRITWPASVNYSALRSAGRASAHLS